MYAKVFAQIFDSSIADDFHLRHFFMDLLVLADPNGCVDMTPTAIAARTRIPLEQVTTMLAKLEQPDRESRTPDADGRRIERLDDHRSWGWHIINYNRFREIASEEQRRAKTRDRVAICRAKRQQNATGNASVTLGNASVTLANAGNAMQKEKETKRETKREDVGKLNSQGAAAAAPASSDSEWLQGLRADAAYTGIDVQREHSKMLRWCQENRRQPTRRRFVNWLNRCDRSITSPTSQPTGAPAGTAWRIDPTTI